MRFFSFFRNLYDRRYINVLAFGGKQDKIMNVNYMEAQHTIAGVDAQIRPFFYPTMAEKAWAQTIHSHRRPYWGRVISEDVAFNMAELAAGFAITRALASSSGPSAEQERGISEGRFYE